MYFLLYLNISIFHLVSAILLLSLNMVLISLTNLSQYWKSSSFSIWLNFFYTYIPATSPLSWARIAVILLSVAITLLLLRNNQISLYHFSNLIWSPSNHPRSGTIIFGMTAYFVWLYTTSAGTVDISSVVSVSIVLILSKISSSVIFNDQSHSDNGLMSISQYCQSILFVCGFYHKVVSKVQWPNHYDVPVV